MDNGHAKRLSTLKILLAGANYHRALKALHFAARHHVGTRKDGVTPEFDH